MPDLCRAGRDEHLKDGARRLYSMMTGPRGVKGAGLSYLEAGVKWLRRGSRRHQKFGLRGSCCCEGPGVSCAAASCGAAPAETTPDWLSFSMIWVNTPYASAKP